MKRLLEYLLLIIMAAVFNGSADSAVSSGLYEDMNDISIYDSVQQTNISAPESQLNLPRQTSIVNGPNAQYTVRRTSSAHRNSIEFAKSGKVVNARLRYFIQSQSFILHSSHVEPSHRLLYLCKFII